MNGCSVLRSAFCTPPVIESGYRERLQTPLYLSGGLSVAVVAVVQCGVVAVVQCGVVQCAVWCSVLLILV